MKSFQDLDTNKNKNIFEENFSNKKRKFACSKKMMKNKLDSNINDSIINSGVNNNINSPFSRTNTSDSNNLNKSFEFIIESCKSDDLEITTFNVDKFTYDRNSMKFNKTFSENTKNSEKFNIVDNEKGNVKNTEDSKSYDYFFEFINNKLKNFQTDMLDYLNKSKIDLEDLYKKFYQKIMKVSTDKARRISQVYNKDYNQYFLLEKNSLMKTNINNNSNDLILNNINDNNISELNLNFSTPFNSFKKINLLNNEFSHEPNFQETFNISEESNKNKSYTQNFELFENQFVNKELENLKSFTYKYLTERLDTMFELHDNLKLSVKQNIDLMKNFLNEYDFNSLNPMQEYVDSNANEICNSWILPKVKFEKLNLNRLIKNNNIPKIFRNYLLDEDSQSKFTKYIIEKSVSYELDKKILKLNNLFLEKIYLNGFNSQNEMEKIFNCEEIVKLNFENIKSIKFMNSNIDFLSYLFNFKNLQRINSKNCIFCFIPKNLSENFSSLKKINFSKSKINNKSLIELMNEFEKLNFLEEINLSSNDISVFNYFGSNRFNNLHTLILRKNKISKFYLKNKNLYPVLSLVDLCYNNIVDLNQVNELINNNKLVLLGRNLALHNNIREYKEYLLNLKVLLEESGNKIKKFDLSYLYFTFKNQETFHLKNIIVNNIFLFNIKKLDLSFNNLHDEDLSGFLNNNRGLVNLKNLVLKNNRLSEIFFKNFVDLELNNLYEYLEIINLSNNNINYNCLENIFTTLSKNKNLKRINLNNNPIENNIYSFFCKRMDNKQKNERFLGFFNNLEKLRSEKKNSIIGIKYNCDLFEFFSKEAKEFYTKFIHFEKY